jgi:hypothetical protein
MRMNSFSHRFFGILFWKMIRRVTSSADSTRRHMHALRRTAIMQLILRRFLSCQDSETGLRRAFIILHPCISHAPDIRSPGVALTCGDRHAWLAQSAASSEILLLGIGSCHPSTSYALCLDISRADMRASTARVAPVGVTSLSGNTHIFGLLSPTAEIDPQ